MLFPVAPHLTVVMLPRPSPGEVPTWVDVLGVWVPPLEAAALDRATALTSSSGGSSVQQPSLAYAPALSSRPPQGPRRADCHVGPAATRARAPAVAARGGRCPGAVGKPA